MKTYKIHLIRHGQTEANAKGLYNGMTDLPLSPEGLAELLTLKREYTYPGAARFFTSPLTAASKPWRCYIPAAGRKWWTGWRNAISGTGTAAAWRNCKAIRFFYAGWQGTAGSKSPTGENADAFQKRVMAAFEELVQELMRSGDTEAVVCTHGGVIMLLMMAYALPKLEMSDCVAESGNGFTLRITPSVWMREPVAEALCMIPWKAEE